MLSIKERMSVMEGKISEQSQEIDALRAANDEYKADAEAMAISMEAVKAEAQKAVAEAQAKIVDLEAKVAADDEAIKALTVERDELKAKVELIPAEDAGAGQAAVADGTVAAPVVEEVDHVKVVNSLEGAEKIAYYRKHKAEIDAAYKR